MRGLTGMRKAALAALPLYIAFGAVLGFVQTALPAILQHQGMPLAQVGLATLLYLPFGISVIWAPLVDRYQIARLGRRRSWIIVCQALSATFLVIAALFPPTAALLLLAPVSFSAATMDLALDGFLVETARDDADRAMRGPLKVGGMLLGMVIGATLILALHEHLGWTSSVGLLAVLTALAPIGFARGLESKQANILKRQRPRISAVLRLPGGARLIVANAFVAAAIGLGIGGFRLLLVAEGLPLSVIGFVFGVVGSVSGILGAAVGALLGRACTARQVLLVTGLILAGCMALPAGTGKLLTDGGLAAAIFISISYGTYAMLFGAICSIAMKWCGEGQAATDYALFQSSWTIAGIVGGGLAGATASGLGWTAVFLIAAICTLGASWLSATVETTANRLAEDIP
ncbi:MAG: MFS transporter [Rhodospirillales bacterium]|nr:MFS transporter [Rhodospirillales bacterium]